MSRFRLLLCICVLGIGGLLAGCMKGEQTTEEIDAPQNQSEEGENNQTNPSENMENEEVTETKEQTLRELYLIDENGLVVPQKIELPKSDSAAAQALEYLVKDGPVTELLPSGFQAVLPAGTEIHGVNLEEDGTLTVDVSEDFSNYEAENELGIIQAMTHTLTQFESVDRIKLWINGENQSEMPVDNTPISEGYTNEKGINLDVSEKPDLNKKEAATIFYPKQYDGGIGYVPVTTYVDKEKDDNKIDSMMQALLDGPSYGFIVQDVFNDGTELNEKPSIKDGVLKLEFNDAILKDKEESIIADEVMETLVRTMTGHADVKEVEVSVENHQSVVAENGKAYEAPVGVQLFEGKEKM